MLHTKLETGEKSGINYRVSSSDGQELVMGKYLPPLIVAAESEFLFDPSVTLTPRSEDEEHTDEVDEEEDIDEWEEIEEGKSSAVKILPNWTPLGILWILRAESRTPRQSPNPNSISASSGQEESSEDKTMLSSLEIVDIEWWETCGDRPWKRIKLKEDWEGI